MHSSLHAACDIATTFSFNIMYLLVNRTTDYNEALKLDIDINSPKTNKRRWIECTQGRRLTPARQATRCTCPALPLHPPSCTKRIAVLFSPTSSSVCVARVFRIWGDLEIAHGHFQDLKTAQPSRDGWAVSGFWAISRWAKGVFRILNIGAHRYTFT